MSQRVANKAMKLSQVFETSDSLKSCADPQEVLMQMTVGEMADILRASLANGHRAYAPMDWEKEASAKSQLKPLSPRSLESKLKDYYYR